MIIEKWKKVHHLNESFCCIMVTSCSLNYVIGYIINEKKYSYKEHYMVTAVIVYDFNDQEILKKLIKLKFIA